MTAYQLARRLLRGPDVPVVINGWGSDEGSEFEVQQVSGKIKSSFNGAHDTKDSPRDKLGYLLPRECVQLITCERSPYSDAEIKRCKAERKKAAKIKKENPGLYGFLYAEIKGITPDYMADMLKSDQILSVELKKRTES